MSVLALDRRGWLKPLPGVQLLPSPNHDRRPAGISPYLLVIHNISLPPGEFGGEAVKDLFLNRLDLNAHPWYENVRGLKVSAHFLVQRCGSVTQFVSTLDRAWHAGVSRYRDHERCNDFSIGIELEGTDTLPYADEQYHALKQLTLCLRNHHPLRAVQGHEHIAPGRKTDPGPAFKWRRYGREAGWLLRQLPPLHP